MNISENSEEIQKVCYTVLYKEAQDMYCILIVEDDFDISELLQSWLTEAGYQTAEAEDGLKALEVLKAGNLT